MRYHMHRIEGPRLWRRDESLRPLRHDDFSLGCPFERRRINATEFTAPPLTSGSLRGAISEPVLPHHRTHEFWRRLRKRIGTKQRQYVRSTVEKLFFRSNHERILAPRSERGEPQVPFEPRLIRSVNSRRFLQILWLCGEKIDDPVRAVIRTLKFNLVPRPCHPPEKSIRVCNSKRVQRCHRRGRQWQSW